LEAAIAVAIVGLAAVAVLSSFGAMVRTSERASRALEANALAGEQLAVASLLSNAALSQLPDSVAHGRFTPPLERYTWRTSAREVRGVIGLFDVAVTVVWANGEYMIATRLYRPPQPLGVSP
jgi:type II secretory pathway pseudopilin PulG